jgi:hypothetical protein
VLTGVSTAEQGAGLEPLWGPVGAALSRLPGTDVIADCGRLGVDGHFYDLLAQASAIVLITRHNLGEVVRLRERIQALTMALGKRDRLASSIHVVVIADHKGFNTALAEVGQALGRGKGRANVIGGLAYEPRTARQLCGEWGGRLDKSLLARTAREVAGQLAATAPAFGVPGSSGRREPAPALPSRASQKATPRTDARAPWEDPELATMPAAVPPARGRHAGLHTAVPATGGVRANGNRGEPAAELPPWWFATPGGEPDAGTAG